MLVVISSFFGCEMNLTHGHYLYEACKPLVGPTRRARAAKSKVKPNVEHHAPILDATADTSSAAAVVTYVSHGRTLCEYSNDQLVDLQIHNEQIIQNLRNRLRKQTIEKRNLSRALTTAKHKYADVLAQLEGLKEKATYRDGN